MPLLANAQTLTFSWKGHIVRQASDMERGCVG